MTDTVEPFDFKACLMVLRSTGKRASTLRELRSCIGEASESCLFHHTCQYFLKGHILEYTSDFAQWAGESLEERALAEILSNIDPYYYPSIEKLRSALIEAIDGYLAHFTEPRQAREGDEFFFNETVTFVFPLGVKSSNLAEFRSVIEYVDPAAIYYHFFEARIRHGEGARGIDDFSHWVEEVLGKQELAKRLRAIDPFMRSLENVRLRIVEAVEETVRKEMEVVEF